MRCTTATMVWAVTDTGFVGSGPGIIIFEHGDVFEDLGLGELVYQGRLAGAQLAKAVLLTHPQRAYWWDWITADTPAEELAEFIILAEELPDMAYSFEADIERKPGGGFRLVNVRDL